MNNDLSEVNRYLLIDSIIIDLDGLSVSGAKNMRTILEMISKLTLLKNILKNEEKADPEHSESNE